MRVSFVPHTAMGRWSVGLAAASVLVYAGRHLLKAYAGASPGQTFFANPLLATILIGAWALASAALFSGLASLFWNRQLSVLVVASSLFGLFWFVFGIGEVLFPH